jgi:hypothetical protein
MDFDYQADSERSQEQYRRYDKGVLSSQYIDSPRTVRLLDEVWERIPEDDRDILRRAIVEVIDKPYHGDDPERCLGSVCDQMGTGLIDGIEFVPPWSATAFLNSHLLSECDEDAAKAVIAHELAHVVLRHPSMTYPFALMSELGPDEEAARAKVREVHEWEADLQAWMWGFSDELRRLWEHLECDPPPWHHQISPEPPISRHYETDELLQILRELAEELGHTPTVLELGAREDLPSPYTYRDRFGRWSEALREAGL